MSRIKNKAIVHAIFGGIGSLSFFAGSLLLILKLAEIGMGPQFGWPLIGGGGIPMRRAMTRAADTSENCTPTTR